MPGWQAAAKDIALFLLFDIICINFLVACAR